MKAWFARRYGGPDVLCLEDMAMPAPGPGQVLVRIHATTVNSGDVRIRGCNFPPGMKTLGRLALGWNGPRRPVLGTELSGMIEAVGSGVVGFAPGDAVYAFPGMRQGAHAQYIVLPETGAIAHLPAGLDVHTAAALCFSGTTALHYLGKADVRPGQTMLVLGGSGAVGMALIQLARHQGIAVTATTSAPNLPLVQSLGATPINYRSVDLARLGQRFDVVADTVAASDFATAQTLLNPGGRYLAIAGGIREMLQSLRPGARGTRMIAGPAAESRDAVIALGRLASEGHFRPHIERVFPFAELPAAHAHVDSGRKRGSVVVSVID
ncbi:NADPH:quinone reductase [Devosia lucknowensis]|uniref:NADPH:quinone reductase n=1 Tax=Devosia lucknowensis TaxID=1096929 RepID=A0A1Y6EAK8_9HYPH|nr:NAD(P)-dependent alcohol dehydrogenase [Devosia lucknowensis]SMQ59519.1 NADPH:quinone reductase [Devosia lucknowensis]